MNLHFKYIIVKTGAILFNDQTTHLVVAQGFEEIYSAGFVNITDKGIFPSGRSESIGIDSKPELDEVIISDLFLKVSRIKYYAYSVESHYSQFGFKPIKPKSLEDEK